MNSFTNIDEAELERIDGGYPTRESSFGADVGWLFGVIAGGIYDGARAYTAGARSGGWSYTKVGYR